MPNEISSAIKNITRFTLIQRIPVESMSKNHRYRITGWLNENRRQNVTNQDMIPMKFKKN